MNEEHILKYFHPDLNIGFQDIRNVWLLDEPPVKLQVEIHRGCLVYRLPGSRRRISYNSLKKGLVRKNIIIHTALQLLPF